MADTFSQTIDVLSLHRVVVSGTVDDPANVANVEVFEGKTDVGSAHISANGNWRFTVAPPNGGTGKFLSAIVTDAAGNNTTVTSGFDLIANPPEAVGDLFQTMLSTPAVTNVFSSSGDFFLSLDSQFNNTTAIDSVSETGNGPNVPFFCFSADGLGFPGSIESDISNFHVAKATHDVLDLSNGPFTTIAQVLRHTSTFQGSATIHLDQTSSVTLDGVTKAQLTQHHNVFFFG